MSLDFPRFALGGLLANGSYNNDTVTLQLVGNAETSAMSSLEALLKKLHSEVTRLGVRRVIVDLRHLAFMNSSCFKTFVTWLSQVQEAERSKQYMIHFLSDTQKHWQKRSLNALSCFAVDLVRVET